MHDSRDLEDPNGANIRRPSVRVPPLVESHVARVAKLQIFISRHFMENPKLF